MNRSKNNRTYLKLVGIIPLSAISLTNSIENAIDIEKALIEKLIAEYDRKYQWNVDWKMLKILMKSLFVIRKFL